MSRDVTIWFSKHCSDEAIAAFLEACGESINVLSLNNISRVSYHQSHLTFLLAFLPSASFPLSEPESCLGVVNDVIMLINIHML